MWKEIIGYFCIIKVVTFMEQKYQEDLTKYNVI